MTELVRAATLIGYFRTARSLGLDTIPLLRAAGLSRAMLVDREQMLPAQSVIQLLESSAKASDVSTFALHMAENRSLTDMGIVSLLIAHQPTLREALGIMEQYRNRINANLVLQIEIDDEIAILREDFSLRSGGESRQASDLALGFLSRICATLLASQWRPESVHFTYATPLVADQSIYAKLFNCPAMFQSAFSGIVIKSADLDLPNTRADAMLALHAQTLLDTILSPKIRTIAQEVEQSILVLLPSGRASIRSSADALGLNIRTLQRHLADAGASFSDLLNNVRLQQVARHLPNPKLRMTDIADLLGYATLGSFTRWYITEFSETPSKARKRALSLR